MAAAHDEGRSATGSEEPQTAPHDVDAPSMRADQEPPSQDGRVSRDHIADKVKGLLRSRD